MAPRDRIPAAPPAQAGPAAAGTHEHVVEFYETEAFLVETVTDFVGPGLHVGGAAVVVATAAHRYAFEQALRHNGVDVDHAVDADRYLAFDAAELLGRFIVDGRPDPERFRQIVGAVLDRASAGNRRVRVYGEMVALLWAAGHQAPAIALERLWNDLAATHDFCAPIR